MSWVRIDDKANQHRKQIAAGPVACWLWACGLMYCNGQKARDGIISQGAVLMLYPGAKLAQAEKLVEVGLWERVPNGFRVHDYHEYQPTAEEAAVVAARRAEAGRRGGMASGHTRKQTATIDEAKTKQLASSRLAPGFVHVEAKPNPDPDPDPVPEKKKERVARKPRPPGAETTPTGHADVIAAYSAAYESARGCKPDINGRTGKVAKELITAFGAEEVCAMIAAAFADEFFATKQAELWDIAKTPNRWRGRLGAPPPAAYEPPPMRGPDDMTADEYERRTGKTLALAGLGSMAGVGR